ncbi:DNA/RNA non-specific endonuclease [Yoonia sp. SS1-5]|uniref:DNA/RNA non-specific endonuclease n=1 Tax=Yoonia rhodophyticola TaxID=3137370 RepID=A0AAN0MK24_9RHOB
MNFDESVLEGPGLTWHKAYLLAKACELSYETNPQKVHDVLSASWQMAPRVFSFGNTQGFTAVGNKVAIVAFRGTQGLSDWGSNLRIPSAAHPANGGRVHSGFLAQWQAAEDEVNATLARLNGTRSIWITGHSLGGAVGLMAAIAQSGGNLDGLVTFGQPRALKRDAARAAAALFGDRYVRLVNNRDIVARIPISYTHTGGLIQFDGQGNLKQGRAQAEGRLESSQTEIDNGPGELTDEEEAQIEAFFRASNIGPDGRRQTDTGHELEGQIPLIADHRIGEYVKLTNAHAFPAESRRPGRSEAPSAARSSTSESSASTASAQSLTRLGSTYDGAVHRAAQRWQSHLESSDPSGRRAESAIPSGDTDSLAERHLEGARGGITPLTPDGRALEAIVRADLRPAYYIHRDKVMMAGVDNPSEIFVSGAGFEELALLQKNRPILEQMATGVARIDIFGFSGTNVGTGWVVEDGRTLITNRHVAELFVQGDARFGWEIFPGIRVEANTLAQIQTIPSDIGGRDRPFDVKIESVLYVAGANEPDFAILELSQALETQLEFADVPAEPEDPIAVVGYPAEDTRDNDQVLMKMCFGDIYDVKRLAPGKVTFGGNGINEIFHDASTLGGNSGSPIFDMNAKVVGLHFAGTENVRNYAIPGHVVQAALSSLRSGIHLGTPSTGAALVEDATEAPASSFSDRNGYDAAFLGTDIPLPVAESDELKAQLAQLVDGSGIELKYRNFSVVQNGARRLPMVTAVNIDGTRLRRIPRSDSWKIDRRLANGDQVGNLLYKHNPLDRGHMVRRLDPCWAPDGASDELVAQAQSDTYFYTNAAPQHEDLNQKDWVGLEDYVLDSAEDFGFKASVFTGPVFSDADRPLLRQVGAEDIAIPEEFWKVVVMRDAESGDLVALGYVLSHGPMISSLLKAEFVLGDYKTYQVPIRLIAEKTGLSFGSLSSVDPLDTSEPTESMQFSTSVRRITGPGSISFK